MFISWDFMQSNYVFELKLVLMSQLDTLNDFYWKEIVSKEIGKTR